MKGALPEGQAVWLELGELIDPLPETNRTLGGGFEYFVCSSLLGEDSHVDEHIFQMG